MKTAVKVVVSLLLVTGLIFFYGSEKLVSQVFLISLQDIAVITCFCTLSLMILARRFQLVITVKGIDEKWATVFSLQLMGLAMNQFMPGLYGGDLLRAAYFMPRHDRKKKFLTAAVIYERLNGLAAMFLLGSISSSYVAFSLKSQFWIWITLFLIVLPLSVFACIALMKSHGPGDRLMFKWLELSREVFGILTSLFGNKTILARTFMLSCLSQLISILAYFYLAKCFQADISLAAVACAVTLAWLVTMIPISLNGLGLRESGLVAVMLMFGVPQDTAVAISLVALIPTLIHAVVGTGLIGINFKSIARLGSLVKG